MSQTSLWLTPVLPAFFGEVFVHRGERRGADRPEFLQNPLALPERQRPERLRCRGVDGHVQFRTNPLGRSCADRWLSRDLAAHRITLPLGISILHRCRAGNLATIRAAVGAGDCRLAKGGGGYIIVAGVADGGRTLPRRDAPDRGRRTRVGRETGMDDKDETVIYEDENYRVTGDESVKQQETVRVVCKTHEQVVTLPYRATWDITPLRYTFTRHMGGRAIGKVELLLNEQLAAILPNNVARAVADYVDDYLARQEGDARP